MPPDEPPTTAAGSGPRRFMVITRRAPHGSVRPQELLDVVLMAAAFEQRVCVVFLDDGVWQLVRGQDPKAAGLKNFAAAFRSLELYDVDELYVEAESLAARGLNEQDLLVPVTVIGAREIGRLMAAQHVILGD